MMNYQTGLAFAILGLIVFILSMINTLEGIENTPESNKARFEESACFALLDRCVEELLKEENDQCQQEEVKK